MSEQLHSFNLGDNAPHEQLVLDQYSNGAKHMYAIEDGKKIHISQDSVLEAYGFDPNAPQDDRGNSEDVVYSDGAQRLVDHEAAQANDQARLKEHAKWHGRVNTVNTEVDLENGRTSGDVQKDAAAANLSGEDVAYEMWLKENAKDLPKDENGNPVRGVKQSMEARAEALRKEWVREKARLNMRVKTGVATPDEVAYYNDLRDMARVENVGDAHDMALVENERRMNQGRIHDVGEAQEAAIAENEAYNQDAAANAAEEEARQAEAEAVRIAEEGRIEGIRAQREALVAAMEGPRDEYLRRVAGNARRGIHWKKEFRKSGVEEARKEYEEARSRLLGFEAAQIRAIGAGAEGDMGEEAIQTEINDVATRLSFSEERDMARALLGHRLVATGQYVREDDGTVTKIERTGMRKVMNKFYDWYARNNAGGKYGKLGMFVKHATVGAAFGAVGLAAGAVLAPTSVGLLGALGGAEVVRRLTRGYMVAHARKSSTELSDTFAARQTQELLNRIGSGTSGKSAVEHVGSMRRREVFRNNARNIITVGSAALFGSGGAALSEHINLGDKVVAGYDRVKDWFADKEVGKTAVAPNISGDTTNGTPYGTDYVPPKPESPVDVGVDTDNGPDFTPTVNVEAGHGYTQELQDLFAQKDINLDGDQSYALYEHLEKQFPGGRFFTDNPSYNMNGDFGIQHPGESTWRPEVLRAIDQWAEDNDVRN